MAGSIEVRIERIARAHDVHGFDCGVPPLDDYLKRFALQNHTAHFAVTHVALVGATVVGFLTLAPSQITTVELSDPMHRLPRYPLPTLTLARLATDRAWQGLGIGAQLLRHSLREALRMAEEFGCIGVRLMAKQEAVGYYERVGFVRLVSARPSDAGLTPMFLPLNQIEDAVRART